MIDIGGNTRGTETKALKSTGIVGVKVFQKTIPQIVQRLMVRKLAVMSIEGNAHVLLTFYTFSPHLYSVFCTQNKLLNLNQVISILRTF